MSPFQSPRAGEHRLNSTFQASPPARRLSGPPGRTAGTCAGSFPCGWRSSCRRGALDQGNGTIGVFAALEADHRRVATPKDLRDEKFNVDRRIGQRLRHGVPQACAVVAFHVQRADGRLAEPGRLCCRQRAGAAYGKDLDGAARARSPGNR